MASVASGQGRRALDGFIRSIGEVLLSSWRMALTIIQLFWAFLLRGWRYRKYHHQYALVSSIMEKSSEDPRLAFFLNISEKEQRITMDAWYAFLGFIEEHDLWIPRELYFDDQEGGPMVHVHMTHRFLVVEFCNVTTVFWRRRDLFTGKVVELLFSKFDVIEVIATRSDVLAITDQNNESDGHEEDGLDK
ncbi:hypothetical protein KC711_02935 [Candidatus Peregrinibacteria bacterium]|nr:hypothetical protein [Candidatus Peregrinibacteria bacterium]